MAEKPTCSACAKPLLRGEAEHCTDCVLSMLPRDWAKAGAS